MDNAQERFEMVAELIINSLFDEYERLSLWNSAYRQALATADDPTEVQKAVERFVSENQGFHGILKYKDLRQQAIQSVRDRSPDEFAAVIPQLKERFAVWDGTQKKTN